MSIFAWSDCPFIQTTLFQVSLFELTCAAPLMCVCYCVVYVGVVIMYTPLAVSSLPCLRNSVICRSVYVDAM
jgi:NADH:ubiquinone oxidoreductase subunit 6 (subunit J)